MSQPNSGRPFILKGETSRAYNLDYPSEMVYEYISDFKVLYSNVPYASKIQLRKTSGRARIFCVVGVLGVEAKALIDVEPHFNPTERTILLRPPTESLGPIPPGYFTGIFTSHLQVAANDKGGSRVSAQIALAFDTSQVALLSYFPPSFITTAAQPLLQQRLDVLCTEYVVKLVEGYPAWLAERNQNK
jgi:hypothetical protein